MCDDPGVHCTEQRWHDKLLDSRTYACGEAMNPMRNSIGSGQSMMALQHAPPFKDNMAAACVPHFRGPSLRSGPQPPEAGDTRSELILSAGVPRGVELYEAEALQRQ